jgi:hypothetical protein
LDGAEYGVFGQAAGVLADGGQVDVGQVGEVAVVVPDEVGYPDAGASEGVEQADRAAVVAGEYGGG